MAEYGDQHFKVSSIAPYVVSTTRTSVAEMKHTKKIPTERIRNSSDCMTERINKQNQRDSGKVTRTSSTSRLRNKVHPQM